MGSEGSSRDLQPENHAVATVGDLELADRVRAGIRRRGRFGDQRLAEAGAGVIDFEEESPRGQSAGLPRTRAAALASVAAISQARYCSSVRLFHKADMARQSPSERSVSAVRGLLRGFFRDGRLRRYCPNWFVLATTSPQEPVCTVGPVFIGRADYSKR